MSFDADLYPARQRRKRAVVQSRRLSCGCPVVDGADTYVRGCCDWVGCAGHAGDEHRCTTPVPEPYPVLPVRGVRPVPGVWERRR